ncbi:MAG: ATP-dependent Clp protease ATP-binding subunit ClpX [Lachnospiraceae bacterium]|nr:ATP-dependent Clp protease ATP-binding subunit ClpX [Lachnospiraceae bacterium]
MDEKDQQEYEKICYMCRRPESKAGSMIVMPGNMCLCHDCMQKVFDSVMGGGADLSNLDLSKVDLSQISGMPYRNLNFNQPENLDGVGDIGVSKKQQIKKKKEKKGPDFEWKDVPAPHRIKHQLDEYVIGQERAKKAIAVAVYNHYKRVYSEEVRALQGQEQEPEDQVRIEKSNILMVGPTGSGKTYLVKTLAKLLDVPLAIADATSLTEAGYIGDDIESVVSKLLAAAGNDVEKAEHGIIFIDEIDKIARKKETSSRDVSGESVQQELLKLLEGSSVEVPVGSNQKNALTPMTTVSTDNILFICGGAFPDLEHIIEERLLKSSSMGFGAQLKDRYEKDANILSHVTNEDLRKFGMIPEFLGRLPVVVTLEKLTKELLVQILKEPKNAILKQYVKLLQMDEVKLVFEDEALEWIAQEALKRETGARALRAILEEYMLDIMYEIPKDPSIGSVIITRPYLEKSGGPLIRMRG